MGKHDTKNIYERITRFTVIFLKRIFFNRTNSLDLFLIGEE